MRSAAIIESLSGKKENEKNISEAAVLCHFTLQTGQHELC